MKVHRQVCICTTYPHKHGVHQSEQGTQEYIMPHREMLEVEHSRVDIVKVSCNCNLL